MHGGSTPIDVQALGKRLSTSINLINDCNRLSILFIRCALTNLVSISFTTNKCTCFKTKDSAISFLLKIPTNYFEAAQSRMYYILLDILSR